MASPLVGTALRPVDTRAGSRPAAPGAPDADALLGAVRAVAERVADRVASRSTDAAVRTPELVSAVVALEDAMAALERAPLPGGGRRRRRLERRRRELVLAADDLAAVALLPPTATPGDPVEAARLEALVWRVAVRHQRLSPAPGSGPWAGPRSGV